VDQVYPGPLGPQPVTSLPGGDALQMRSGLAMILSFKRMWKESKGLHKGSPCLHKE